MKKAINGRQTSEFIRRAYDIACRHGFHDVERSNSHFLMLILGEVGEMVEADRKRNRAERMKFEKIMSLDDNASFDAYFKLFIKDTLEDELADVCIRIYDLLGTRDIEPVMIDGRGVYDMRAVL